MHLSHAEGQGWIQDFRKEGSFSKLSASTHTHAFQGGSGGKPPAKKILKNGPF